MLILVLLVFHFRMLSYSLNIIKMYSGPGEGLRLVGASISSGLDVLDYTGGRNEFVNCLEKSLYYY